MLPFTDIDFFLFAAIYVAMIWLFGFISGKKFYSEITFALTLIYLVFYFKYTLQGLQLACDSWFLSPFCWFSVLTILYDLIIWLRTALCANFGVVSFSELSMTLELT